MEREILLELPGYDYLKAQISESGDLSQIEVQGCAAFVQLLKEYIDKYGSNPSLWLKPKGTNHQDLLIKELILKARGEFKLPCEEIELCHCRNVSTKVIDAAIITGAHTPEAISRATSAGTACGTCRPNLILMIDFRLK